MYQDLLDQFFEKYRDPWRSPFLLKDWQGFLFGFARIDPSGASRETPDGLSRNRTIEWNWDAIPADAKKMMDEGKNNVSVL